MRGRHLRGGWPRLRCALLAAGLLVVAIPLLPAGAQEQAVDWRPEFEAVCVKTDLALTLSTEELADLVARCDRLAERLGAEGEIVRKVYLRRLLSCRALFAYVLETRGAAAGGAGTPVTAPQGQAAPPPSPAGATPADQGTAAPERKPTP